MRPLGRAVVAALPGREDRADELHLLLRHRPYSLRPGASRASARLRKPAIDCALPFADSSNTWNTCMSVGTPLPSPRAKIRTVTTTNLPASVISAGSKRKSAKDSIIESAHF